MLLKEGPKLDEEFSRLIMHKDFTESIREIRKGKINLGTLGSKAYEAESELLFFWQIDSLKSYKI